MASRVSGKMSLVVEFRGENSGISDHVIFGSNKNDNKKALNELATFYADEYFSHPRFVNRDNEFMYNFKKYLGTTARDKAIERVSQLIEKTPFPCIDNVIAVK